MKRRRFVKLAGASAAVFGSGLNFGAMGASASIKIGQSAPLSGPLAPQVQAINRGAALVFDSVNRNGGIGGLPIELISLDDGLQPPKTLANCEKLLLEDRVIALFELFGSGNVMAVKPLLEKTGVPLYSSIGVSDSVREKTNDSAYYVRAGYRRELEKILQQAATIGIRRIALATFNNAGGEEVKTIFVQHLRQLGITPGATVSVNLDGSNVAACAQALAADKPQVVVLFLAGTLPAKFIEAMDALGSLPNFYGMSLVSGEATAKALGSKLRNLVISQIVPFPWAKDNPGIQTFQRLATAASIQVDYATFESYVNASVLVEVIKRAGKDLSPAKLHAATKRIKGQFGGLEVDFTGGTNTGSKFTELVYVTGAARFTR